MAYYKFFFLLSLSLVFVCFMLKKLCLGVVFFVYIFLDFLCFLNLWLILAISFEKS